MQLSRVLLTNIVYIKRRTPYACTDPAGSAKAHFDPVDPTDFSVCRPLALASNLHTLLHPALTVHSNIIFAV